MNVSDLTPLQRAACNLYAQQTGATPEQVEQALSHPQVGSIVADYARTTLTGPYGSFVTEDEVIDASIDGYVQGLKEAIETIDNLVIRVPDKESATLVHEVLTVVKNDFADRLARFEEGTEEVIPSGTDVIADMLSQLLGYPITVLQFEQASR